MHMVLLGLWEHLLVCIFWDIKEYLQSFKQEDGATSIIGKEGVRAVWNQLRDRLRKIKHSESGFKIEGNAANVAHVLMEAKEDKSKSSSIKAKEYLQLMLAMTTQIKNLVEPQLIIINQAISKKPSLKDKYPEGAKDPCPRYIRY